MPRSPIERAGVHRALAIVLVLLVALGVAWSLLDGAAPSASPDDVQREAASGAPDAASAPLDEPTGPSSDGAGTRTAEASAEGIPQRAGSVDAPPEPVERTEGLFARTVDSEGTPVSNVALEWAFASRFGGVRDGYLRGATGPDGLLKIESAEETLGRAFGGGPAASMFARVGLRCAMPFEELTPTEEDEAPYVTWLDERPAPGAVVDVVVPPHGFVRFTWEPPPSPHGGLLHPLWIGVRRSDGDHFPGWRFGGPIEEGATEYTFGPVGLGWEVWGGISRTGLLDRLGGGNGPGPTRAGETVHVALEVAPEDHDLVVLSGRAVTADGYGERLRGRVYLELGPSTASKSRRRSVTFDEGGRFELILRRGSVPRALTVRAGHGDEELVGSRALPPLDEAERILDAGEVRLAPLPAEPEPLDVALVAGRAVDADGTPLPGVSIHVYGKATRVRGRDVSPEMTSSLASGKTDAAGLFELSAPVVLAGDRVGVNARLAGYVSPRSVSTTPGARDVEFTVRRGADVRVTLRVDDWMLMSESLSFQLGRGQRTADRRGTVIGTDGAPSERAFVFRGLPPGEHAFELELSGSDWEPLRVPVTIAAETDEVDLGVVDVTELFTFASLRLVDADGALVTDGRVTVRGVDPRNGRVHQLRRGYVGDDGTTVLALPIGATRIEIEHPEAGRAEVPPEAVGPLAEGGEPRERTTVTLRR